MFANLSQKHIFVRNGMKKIITRGGVFKFFKFWAVLNLWPNLDKAWISTLQLFGSAFPECH